MCPVRKNSLWTKHSTSICCLPWRLPAAHPLQPPQLKASCAAVKALSQAEQPLWSSRLLSARVPFSGDSFSQLTSECACEVKLFAHCWWWGASQRLFLPTCSPTDKSTISSRSFDVPPKCLPLSSCSWANPILTTFWSTMRAVLSLDVLKERVIQKGLFTCGTQRSPLVPRKGEFCLNYFTFLYLRAPNKGFTPPSNLLWIFTILTVKNPLSCLL